MLQTENAVSNAPRQCDERQKKKKKSSKKKKKEFSKVATRVNEASDSDQN
jgi:hypothetical protein